jgi:hypothetical protein
MAVGGEVTQPTAILKSIYGAAFVGKEFLYNKLLVDCCACFSVFNWGN